jgi:hypothetical protein
MLRYNRVFLSKNSVLTDLSQNLSLYLSGTEQMHIVATQDALYLGSDLPFNHRWIEISVANSLASALSVALWDGSAWQPAVDVIDETSVSSVTLSQSGYLSWNPDRRNATWVRAGYTEDVPELSSLRIYDLYWAKLTFSANLQSPDRLYVSTAGADVVLSDLGGGVTLTDPTADYDVYAHFNQAQIAASSDLTAAITGGTLTWKRRIGGAVQSAASYTALGLITYPYLKYVGHKFSNDADLFTEYKDLADPEQLDAFSQGKTDWNDQTFLAAEYIIQDLREMGVIFSRNQILDWSQFKIASVHKTAHIIYNSFGPAYEKQQLASAAKYAQYLKLKAYNVDLNANADLEPGEKRKLSSFFTR